MLNQGKLMIYGSFGCEEMVTHLEAFMYVFMYQVWVYISCNSW